MFGAGGTRTLTYDAAGNVTFDNRNGPGYGYNYDAANRMSSFAINGVIQAEYDYNALGQQVIRRLPAVEEEQCEDCGPLTNPQARALAELFAGLVTLSAREYGVRCDNASGAEERGIAERMW